MITYRTPDGRIVYYNGNHIALIPDDPELETTMDGLLQELASVAPGLRFEIDHARHEHRHEKVIALHRQQTDLVLSQINAGHLLLSPTWFTMKTDEFRITGKVARQFAEGTKLGRSIIAMPGLYGFFDALGHDESKSAYRRLLNLVVASLSTSIGGVDDIADVPPDAFLDWMQFYRDKRGIRWDNSLWGRSSGFATRCIREVTFTYAQLTGHNHVPIKLKAKRSDAKNEAFWADIENSTTPHIQVWFRFFKTWRETRPGFSATYRQMLIHLLRWMAENYDLKLAQDVGAFLAKARRPSFSMWIIDQFHKSNKATSGDTLIVYLSYAKRFSEFVGNELVTNHGEARQIFHLVTEDDIGLARNAIARGGSAQRSAEAKSRPLPMRMYKMVREILEEGESGWPGTVCQETVRILGGHRKVYCPVLPTLFLSLFHLPLRVGQMKRLDSGEGDIRCFDATVMMWRPNDGANLGYWKRQLKGEENRGYAYEFRDSLENKSITGFAVNTNKTGKPYRVPWQNETLHRMLYGLRLWQEEHNPVVAPIGPELYVDQIDEADEGKTNDYPDIFPLFRLPADPRSGRQGCPPNQRRTHEFWQRLMEELERRWNESHPPDQHVRPVNRQKSTGQTSSASYNPHGLRVSGLTLMVAQGVPFEVVSKLIAGHASILMTLYYIKYDPARVHELLEEAAQKREAEVVDGFVRDLKNLQFEAAQRRAACLSSETLRMAVSMNQTDKLLWSNTGIGLCPWDGARCHDGGPMQRKSVSSSGADNSTYGPVEGGQRNCVLCRHFITGPAWQNALWLYGTKLTRKFATKAKRVEDITNERCDLEDRIEALRRDGEKDVKLEQRLTQLEVELNAMSREQEILGKGIWSTQQLLEACAAIFRKEDAEEAPKALVVHEQHTAVEYLEVSDFEQAAIITAASRVYPILHDNEAEAARDRFLDAVMFHSGMQPITLAPLSVSEKRRGMDAFAQFIMRAVEREELHALETGALRLQDLRIEGEAAAIVSVAIGRPIQLQRPSPTLSMGL